LSLGAFYGRLKYDSIMEKQDKRVMASAAELRQMLTKLGPTFIKVGQLLANRPDILRSDYMEELCILQDDVPPFPTRQAFDIIESSLGRPLDEVFSAISDEPVAAASLGQVYRATLRNSGEDVAIKVQRPQVQERIEQDLVIFRWVAGFLNDYSRRNLGCDAQLIVDEFGEKLLEELDYVQEARNIDDFYRNFEKDRFVKIPWVSRGLSGPQIIVMEWIDGIRCTDPESVKRALNVDEFIRVGVASGLKQLLEFGLFHGDPHPGNVFALRDGRIAYVDFGNVAEVSEKNKQALINAVVHAVNADYEEMAGDFIELGFLSRETDIRPIVPALEQIWSDSLGQSLSDFNFRSVTTKFNELVYQYPIRIPERFSLVIRTLLTQEGICLTLKPEFRFLEVAYPYVAKRLLTDDNLRPRLTQVLFKDGVFQWSRLRNLLQLANDGAGQLDLTETIRDFIRITARDRTMRSQLISAITQDNTLQVSELMRIAQSFEGNVDVRKLVEEVVREIPSLSAYFMLELSNNVMTPVPALTFQPILNPPGQKW